VASDRRAGAGGAPGGDLRTGLNLAKQSIALDAEISNELHCNNGQSVQCQRIDQDH
jgi:hypothetical protein